MFLSLDFDEDDPLAGLSLDEDSISEAGKKQAAKKAPLKEQKSLEDEAKVAPSAAQPCRVSLSCWFFFSCFINGCVRVCVRVCMHVCLRMGKMVVWGAGCVASLSLA